MVKNNIHADYSLPPFSNNLKQPQTISNHFKQLQAILNT